MAKAPGTRYSSLPKASAPALNPTTIDAKNPALESLCTSFRNRFSYNVEQTVVALAMEDHSLGQILRQRQILISPAGVRYMWLKHNLEIFQKRLDALEERVAKTGEVPNDAQLRAMEKTREDKIALG